MRVNFFERARQTSENKNSIQSVHVRKSTQCYAAIPAELCTAIVSQKESTGKKVMVKRQHRELQ